MNMDIQNNFSSLLKKLLDEAMETNRCWAKLSRIRNNDPYRKDYIRYAEDGDKARAIIANLLVNGKYSPENKEVEISAVNKAIEQVESHGWELDFIPHGNRRDYASREEKWLKEFLSSTLQKIESGEQKDIEKTGQEALKQEQEKQNNEEITNRKAELSQLSQEVESLSKKNELELEDYWKIKELKKQVSNNTSQKEIKSLQESLDKLEEKIPKQVKIKFQAKDSYCIHWNIYWPAMFQKEKSWPTDLKEKPYCLDCGEDKNNEFCSAFQKWYCRKIEEWLTKNGLIGLEFREFLSKKNYLSNWFNLENGNFITGKKELDLPNLGILRHLHKYLESYSLKFAEEKGIKINNMSSVSMNNNHYIKDIEREREREREREIKFNLNNLNSFPKYTN